MVRRMSMVSGALILGLSCGFGATGAFAEKLPVYKLGKAAMDRGRASEMFSAAMDRKPTVQDSAATTTLRSGRQVLELDKRSGHIFMADMEKLWNPQARPQLPSRNEARSRADGFLKAQGVAMQTGGNVTVKFSHFSETGTGEDGAGADGSRQLDRQVNYTASIRVRQGGSERELPVTGGGAKYQVSIGEGGRVVGFRGGLREVVGQAANVDIKTKAQAIAEFQKSSEAEHRNIRAELAYYAAPGFEKQDYLAPVWVIHSEIQVGERTIPARIRIIAATGQYGPKTPPARPGKARDPKMKPPSPSNSDEKPSQQHGLLDWLITPAHAASGYECGTSWIGNSQGLPGSYYNKQGFVDGCRAAGWNVRFDWGDSNAFESDWRRNDDSYVDNVDLVFYTGHADQNGWVLNNPDDTSLYYSEVGGSPDFWGNNDVEWIIIAACGPFQSTHFTTNTTNAFSRWRSMFDGLHVMMGYASVTKDNRDEGRRFMELTRAGWNVIDAWFRTAWEIQDSWNGWPPPDGSRIYAVAMYAHNGDNCTRDDHLWGMGRTCPDVPAGSTQRRTMMWTGT